MAAPLHLPIAKLVVPFGLLAMHKNKTRLAFLYGSVSA